MDQEVYSHAKVLWDYMQMHMKPRKSDLIAGFGCCNEDIALRCAELYWKGYGNRILFTGGLGRVTKGMWSQPEADRFAAIALEAGVPEGAILIENKSENTGENIVFMKNMLGGQNIQSILGVHKPFMERRVYAAMGVYWPEIRFTVTSPRYSMEEYIRRSEQRGIPEKKVISVLAGNYQRVKLYGEKGYQIPQPDRTEARRAFEALVKAGYDDQLVSP